mmetsp:Transcript_9882/g.30273  ORF Transcript_9882/g.30273 Transcript_9882/m.30273 type:complete len:165 (-) Transcript_9882:615-1109(-)
MEIFCFLAMGGSVGDIILLDVRTHADQADDNAETAGAPSVRVRGGSFRTLWRSGSEGANTFCLEEAQCSIDMERDRMLGVIEASYGDLSLFEADLKELFTGTRSSLRWSQAAKSGNLRPDAATAAQRRSKRADSHAERARKQATSKVNWFFERDQAHRKATPPP